MSPILVHNKVYFGLYKDLAKILDSAMVFEHSCLGHLCFGFVFQIFVFRIFICTGRTKKTFRLSRSLLILKMIL